ncbi:MAG: hypothetical protein JSU65_03165 [Candidatus Zixiibacteriota bacterium]|nr:MAG: hypothetical protein JSU65_03165 [candidate division Zixibacteria bacterium]
MTRLERLQILLTFILVAFTFTANAEVPRSINYQGRVTDPSTGDPLSGTVNLAFAIYSCESCTYPEDILWSESHAAVPLDNGLFSVILHDIPDSAFTKPDRWLGITVNTDPELTPRNKLTSVAYSYRALKADTAIALIEEIYLDETGDDLTGNLNLGAGGVGGTIEVGPDYANVKLRDNNNATTEIYGDIYGEVILYDMDYTETAQLTAHSSSGGELKLSNGDGTPSMKLYAGGSSGDLKVILPDSAINADEILDEPGVARDARSFIILTAEYQTLASVDITTPAPGYVYLIGRCDVYLTGMTVNTGVALLVDSPEGTPIGAYIGYVSGPVGTDRRHPAMVDGMYYNSEAGTFTYTFYGAALEESGTLNAMNITLTAIYLPTSYAAVTTMVSNPSDFPDAVPVPTYDLKGNPTGETKYKVDLRQLELKAKQKRIEALEAELEFEQARTRVTDR